MLRIQSLPFAGWYRKLGLVLLMGALYGLLPSVVQASSVTATQAYNGYKNDGYPGHVCATHVYVHRGDTLSRIAAQNGVSVYEIAQVNYIPNTHRIYPGQYLCIPGRHDQWYPADSKHDDYPKWPHDDYDYGKHDKYGKWYCGCPDGHHDGKKHDYYDDKYPVPQKYPQGYYESTGGHTGVHYYPDPRYNPSDAHYYEAAKPQGHYRVYP